MNDGRVIRELKKSCNEIFNTKVHTRIGVLAPAETLRVCCRKMPFQNIRYYLSN